MSPEDLRRLIFDMLIRPAFAGPDDLDDPRPVIQQMRNQHNRRLMLEEWRVSYPRVWRGSELWVGVIPRNTIAGYRGVAGKTEDRDFSLPQMTPTLINFDQLAALSDALILERDELRVGCRSLRWSEGQASAPDFGPRGNLSAIAHDLWSSTIDTSSAPYAIVEELLAEARRSNAFLVLSMPSSLL